MSTTKDKDANSENPIEQLWQNVENLKLMLSTIGYGIYAVNSEGLCTFVNKTALDMLDFETEQEVIGKFMHDLIHHSHEDGARYHADQCAIYSAVVSGTGNHRTDEVFWRKNDSSFPVEYWTYPIISDGEQLGCVVIFNDISSRLLTENQRQQLISQLEKKNAELERFLYTASHDLKSPLVTIKGFAGAIQKELAGKQQYARAADDARRIEDAADKMQELINDLLHFSHMGQEAAVQKVSLDEVIQDAVNNLSAIIAEKNVELLIQRDLPVVSGNRHRLVEVYQNLIENAVKFSAENTIPEIHVGYKLSIDNASYSEKPVFFVKDNGIGIEPQYFDKVFNLFERLNAKVPGAGVGLAIVKRIINQHGGQVWIESDGINRGVTFFFTLSSQETGKHTH